MLSRNWRSVIVAINGVLLLLQVSSAPGSESISYSYDALGRLIQVIRAGTVNNGTQSSYSYDAAGNRTNSSVVTPATACAAIGFSVNDVAQYEGTPLAFVVTKTGSASTDCSVSYATANGSAVAPNDYGAASGTLTFTANQTSKTVSVSTVVAGPNESTEYMYVNLSGATGGASITDAQGKGAIYNNFDGCVTCRQSSLPLEVE